MSLFGKYETWKVVYILPPAQQNNGAKGVALIEATDRAHALGIFMREYAGQFHTIDTCEKLLG